MRPLGIVQQRTQLPRARSQHEIEYDDWDTWGDHLLYAGPNASYRADQWWVTLTPLVQLTDTESEPNFQLRLLFGIDF